MNLWVRDQNYLYRPVEHRLRPSYVQQQEHKNEPHERNKGIKSRCRGRGELLLSLICELQGNLTNFMPFLLTDRVLSTCHVGAYSFFIFVIPFMWRTPAQYIFLAVLYLIFWFPWLPAQRRVPGPVQADGSETGRGSVLGLRGAEPLLTRCLCLKLGNEEENFGKMRKLWCDSALLIWPRGLDSVTLANTLTKRSSSWLSEWYEDVLTHRLAMAQERYQGIFNYTSILWTQHWDKQML